MAKKICAQSRLVKGQRWYIDYITFDPETGKESRHRQDFDLNDIEDLAVRELVANSLIKNLNHFIKSDKANSTEANSISVYQAVEMAMEIKFRLPRKSSHSHYRSVGRAFLKWCTRSHYASIPITEFTQKYARAFWDWLTGLKKYAGRTLNNYLTCLKALWSEMIERELILKNIWSRIKPARVEEKKRRPFTDDERRIVANWVQKNDYWMFRGILLQFFCYIRPIEISRLKFRDFDFGKGTVTILEGNAKSWKKRVATLPKSIMHYFVDGRFDKYPGNFYVLGRIPAKNGRWEMYPSTTPLNENRMNKRHSRILIRLKEEGLLHNIEGLSWYSWKDTGISMHTRKTSPVSTKDQAGHRDLSITSLYYHAETINFEYRKLENDLVD